jgi:hypothetical protein
MLYSVVGVWSFTKDEFSMERNIFEAAANEFNKSSKKPQTKTPQPAKTSKKATDGEFGVQDPETLTMLNQMRQMRLQLKNQLSEMYDLGKKYHLDVDSLLKTSQNMNPKELQQIFQEGEQFEKQIKGILKPESGVVKRTGPKSAEALEKERKSKTLGSRKKNWISVH